MKWKYLYDLTILFQTEAAIFVRGGREGGGEGRREGSISGPQANCAIASSSSSLACLGRLVQQHLAVVERCY